MAEIYFFANYLGPKIMPLSAKHYVERGDACRAGRMAGDAYALVVLAAMAFMCWAEVIKGGWATLWTGALVVVGLRVGMEWWMGQSWDHLQARRSAVQNQGATAIEAYSNVE